MKAQETTHELDIITTTASYYIWVPFPPQVQAHPQLWSRLPLSKMTSFTILTNAFNAAKGKYTELLDFAADATSSVPSPVQVKAIKSFAQGNFLFYTARIVISLTAVGVACLNYANKLAICEGFPVSMTFTT
jgi:hypothetical protein